MSQHSGQIVHLLSRESPDLGFTIEAQDGLYTVPWFHYVRAKLRDPKHVQQTLEVKTSDTLFEINGMNLRSLLEDFRQQRVTYIARAPINQMTTLASLDGGPFIENITAKEIE